MAQEAADQGSRKLHVKSPLGRGVGRVYWHPEESIFFQNGFDVKGVRRGRGFLLTRTNHNFIKSVARLIEIKVMLILRRHSVKNIQLPYNAPTSHVHGALNDRGKKTSLL